MEVNTGFQAGGGLKAWRQMSKQRMVDARQFINVKVGLQVSINLCVLCNF